MGGVRARYLEDLQAGMNDAQRASFHTQYAEDKKDRNIALVLSIIVGTLGIDRFYLGQILLGVLKLITAGGFGVWYIIDWFLIMGATDAHNLGVAARIANRIRAQGAPPEPGPPTA